jgi:hypothetical protein
MYAQCAMRRVLTCYLYIIGWETKWFTVHEVLGSRIMIDAKLCLFDSDTTSSMHMLYSTLLYEIYPFSTAISAFMTELVAAPSLTLSIKQTNLTSRTLHSLTLPTETQAPLCRSLSNLG